MEITVVNRPNFVTDQKAISGLDSMATLDNATDGDSDEGLTIVDARVYIQRAFV